MYNNQNRFKSPIFWGVIVTNILALAKVLGYLEPLGIDNAEYNEITIIIAAIINAFGAANNPKEKKTF